MIFKRVQDGKPYPDHDVSGRTWATIPPRQFRLDELSTTTTVLALDRLLSEDSTFYGDLFAHVVKWQGELYLEDGLHRAVRSALRSRNVIHARMLDLDAFDPANGPVEEQMRTADTGPVVRPPRSPAPPQFESPSASGTDRRRIRRGWQTPNW
ncbi:MAG: type II toxin-antitoxin system VapB family antitoxin [Gordonia sp.]|uniref:type II toxin-antitoxin system VapB family antitoxin n=1 Tax=Gordonia sp. (in: high G+C Gram-positive bacteria) TaxID=84139 RepID=UPI001DCC4E00|nr:type II toxin-antitoxin system VapB family antitoxin [Gordonia sp. (in: high G+C Gram-positive bacteria)]MCB1295779.1 type II toxin-antitoxin system VapB family antitoxin [Gordonia sp. (in: high G+C Gram-positive bacteria)]